MNRLRIAVALVILGIWTTAWIISFVDRTYAVPGSLTPPALLAIGYLLGKEIREQLRGGSRPDDG